MIEDTGSAIVGRELRRRRHLNGHHLRAVPVAEYKDLMSAFPTGIAVVTTADADGNPCGMTCSSMTSVTLQPPTLLVCLRVGSLTLQAARDRGRFAANLLNARARHVAEVFSTPVPDRFAQVHWERLDSGLPWLSHDSFAVAECRITGSGEVGDHAIILGQVVFIAQSHGFPLLYWQRRFRTWAQDDGGSELRGDGSG
jgi:flavin reductase (DIM6/NTAB) family NADH-FMN oxidoreductase RutF